MTAPVTHVVRVRLRTLRERRGLTREQVAQRAMLHPLTIAHFEEGSALPTLTELERLARALRVHTPELLR